MSLTLEDFVKEYLYIGLDVGCGCCAADEGHNIDHLVMTLEVCGFEVPPSLEHRRCGCRRLELRDKYVVYEGPYIHYHKNCCHVDTPQHRAEELYESQA